MRRMDLQPATDFFLSCETLLEYRRCPVSHTTPGGEM
jgi:hypothetical protein